MNDVIFRACLALIAGLLSAIRIYYGRRARQFGGRVVARRAPGGRTALLWLLGTVAVLASTLYVVAPRRIRWATIALPRWARWFGIGFGGVTVVLFGWVHRALGVNWSMPAELKAGQTLVTSGPYRWVRHPMYTTIFMWAAAFLLLSANWLVGAPWIGLALTASALAPLEEETLLETFGDAYRDYMGHTGRYLPRLKRGYIGMGTEEDHGP